MKRFILAVAAALIATQALAVDLAKAPQLSLLTSTPCTLTNCTGPYMGFNIAGIATSANVIGNGINGSLAAGGQNIGFQVGYQYWNGTFFMGPEIFGDYTYGGSAVVAGYSAPKYLFGEIIKLGGPLSSFFGGIAPASTTGLSSVLTSQTIAPYIFMGAAQRPWGTGMASGGGVTFLIDQHWFADVRYMNIQYTGSNNASPIQTVPQENIVMAGFNYKF
jgi:opacity protein-like surface antigen